MKPFLSFSYKTWASWKRPGVTTRVGLLKIVVYLIKETFQDLITNNPNISESQEI